MTDPLAGKCSQQSLGDSYGNLLLSGNALTSSLRGMESGLLDSIQRGEGR